jgi:hypothetical protein
VTTVSRSGLYQLIDELPEAMLPEVFHFLEFLHFKLENEVISNTPYTPVPLGGLWQDVTITDKDIDTVRQEMWQGFGETSE